MSRRVLVTGGTGVLGRAVVRRLAESGQDVRVMSRRPRQVDDVAPYGWAVADLASGAGVDLATDGADAVIHCATASGRGKEIDLVRTLIESARRADSPHLVYISIVGVDRVRLGYYQDKLAAERLVEDSGLPSTILRATQFHDLVRAVFATAARAPVMVVPAFSFQPIDVRDVAERLVELTLTGFSGRAPDIAGPEVRVAQSLARDYLRVVGRRRAVLPVRLPGKVFDAYRRGEHLSPQNAVGSITFEDYLMEHPRPTSRSYRGEPRRT